MSGRLQNQYALIPERLFDGSALRDEAVVVDGARVARVCALNELPANLPRRSVPGLLAPGLIDLQVNGGGGCQWNDDPGVSALDAIARAHRAQGTTALLPTLISPAPDVAQRGLASTKELFEKQDPSRARILGIHLEGPHLNRARAGAHPEAALRPLGDSDMAQLLAPCSGAILCTVAPEVVGADAIQRLAQNGVVVFAGHSEASADQIEAARRAGLRGFTHLYNAMSPLRAREPGVVGAALSERESYCGLIADGVHVDWRSVSVALAAKGPTRLFFVSDAMAPSASDDAPFFLGGARVRVLGRGDGRYCALEDGTLAGSCLTMAAALRNAVAALSLPLESALQMASTTPARALGLQDLGVIRGGAHADFVALNDDLQVLETWVAGGDSEGRRV